MHLEMVSRIIYYFIFPGPKVRLTSLWFPRFFLFFLKVGVIFALSRSLATSSGHHNLLSIFESGLVATLASSLSTHGCFPSGATDFCMSSWFKCSLNWVSSSERNSSLLQTFPWVSGAWDCWRKAVLEWPRQELHWAHLPCLLSLDPLLPSAPGPHFPLCCHMPEAFFLSIPMLTLSPRGMQWAVPRRGTWPSQCHQEEEREFSQAAMASPAVSSFSDPQHPFSSVVWQAKEIFW